jgi:hypothetical protein
MTMSSCTEPISEDPRRSSTPITVSGMPRTRIVWPIGSLPSNSSSTSVWPITATSALLATSSSVNISPLSTGHCRICR